MRLFVENTKTAEIAKILFTLAQIKRGFYQEHGFLLLETVPSENLASKTAVMSSELIARVSDSFDWAHFDDQHWYDNWQTADVSEYEHLLADYTEPGVKFDEAGLKQATEIICDFLDLELGEVQIYPTRSGTSASFDYDTQSQIVRVFPRTDCTNLKILSSIIGAIVRKLYPDKPWSELQQLQHFLTTQTKLKKFFPDETLETPGITDSFHESYSEYLQTSKANFAMLGFPVTSSIVIADDKLELTGYGVIDFLTVKEEAVFRLMLEKTPTVVSFDEIGNILWSDLEKFSLQAIAKLIERIRGKLRLSGLNKDVLFTRRGKGYYYYE